MEKKQKQASKTPMDDQKIIELYFDRDERAIEETDLKYRKYLFSLAYGITHDKSDSEECLSDTYLGAWNAIPPTEPTVLKAFLTTIMRRVAINRYNNNLKKTVIPSEITSSFSELEDFISDNGSIDAEFDAKQLGSVISDFLRSLSNRRQFIFMSRYYAAESIDQIADDLNLSRSMINKELAAIRKSLKETLESEGYFI